MNSAEAINETPVSVAKRSADLIAKRLFLTSPPPVLRKNRKRVVDPTEEDRSSLSLPKKIATPATSPQLVIKTAPIVKSPPAAIYDFDEPVVCTPDVWEPLTQRSPILINTNSPVILTTMHVKKKNVQFSKQKFKPAFKTEAEEMDNTSAQDLQLIGKFLLHFFTYIR